MSIAERKMSPAWTSSDADRTHECNTNPPRTQTGETGKKERTPFDAYELESILRTIGRPATLTALNQRFNIFPIGITFEDLPRFTVSSMTPSHKLGINSPLLSLSTDITCLFEMTKPGSRGLK
jgi:hypothetical protein